MPSTSPLPALPALDMPCGLVAGAASASPVPPLEHAEIQVRAIDHRFVDADSDPGGQLLQALTGDDFLPTDSDGTWHDRASFLSQRRRRPPQQGASAPDYVVTCGDGSLRGRGAALANFAKPTFATQFKSFPVDRVSVRRFDDVALIHAENANELKDHRHGVSRYTDIWHKHDSRWRCIAAHITVHKAPA